MDNHNQHLHGFSAEIISRINAIDPSDPNSISAINSMNNTQNSKIVLDINYGRMRWILVDNQDGYKTKELQQEVTIQYMGESSVTEWRTIVIENN